MSLGWYRRPRLVILKPGSSLVDAARAIEQNRIGAVVVQDRGQVVGIVTDRDLAVRALGRVCDPATTQIREVMTPAPVTLTLADRVDDAVRLMQEHNIRRIPLVDGERVVGIVTLDDLLLDEAVPLEQLAAIVQAQVGGQAAAVAPRASSYLRSVARAEATLARFLANVQADAGLKDADAARVAANVVLAALVRRLTAGEAADFVAQLPSLLRADLQALPAGPDKSVTAAAIADELALRLELDPGEAAELLAAVAGTIAGSVSAGEAEDVRSQLPPDLRALFHERELVPLFI